VYPIADLLSDFLFGCIYLKSLLKIHKIGGINVPQIK